MGSIVYITNTQLPSQKANAYQSMCMCEAFAAIGIAVELWHPARNGDYQDHSPNHTPDAITSIFANSNIAETFPFRRLFSIDNRWLQKRSEKAWFYLQSFSFWVTCIVALQKEDSRNTIFIRDVTALVAFSIAKKWGLIRQNIIFEAHQYSKFINRFAKAADKIVVISRQLKKQIDPDGLHNILVAHAGVRKDDLSSTQHTLISGQNTALRPLQLRQDKDEKVILYTGNLFKWKGVYTLADCIHYLPKNYRIVFVGGSEETLSQFRDYTQNFPQIKVVGFKPRREIDDYLHAADILLLPNSAKYDRQTYVTSPLKLFEYMAAKKPIVAARLPSIQEILQEGKNAVMFSPDDAKDLAEKIQWAATNDCSPLVEQAWQDVQTYTWTERAKQISHRAFQ